MTQHITAQLDGNVLTLSMNRPHKKNALTHAMYTALVEGFDRAESDDTIHVLLLRGAGNTFTTGNDIGDFMASPPTGDDAPVMQFLLRLVRFPKPLVMAVGGLAIGVGATMLLHADLVVAADNASFQMPFINLGLVPEAGSSLLLPQCAGHKLATELLLLGDRFDAATAHKAGLVNRVVPAEEVDALARSLASRLAAKPPQAMALSKALLKGNTDALQARMAEEGAIFIERLGSAEAMAAFAAFMQR